MGFKPGQGGRPPGALNKRSVQFAEVLEKHHFCAASAMLDLYKIAMERFIQDTEREQSGVISPMESNAAAYLKIAADRVSEIASYTYPKLKSVEQIRTNPIEGMTHEQKLRAAEATVEMLKLELKANGSGDV